MVIGSREDRTLESLNLTIDEIPAMVLRDGQGKQEN